MKKIYMVQAANALSKAIYLPYSAGTVLAYSWQFDKIRDNFEFGGFIYRMEPINDVVSKLENPSVVGFSSYLWNIEFNLELAKAIKEKWPQCLTVFGGPQIDAEASLLEESKNIDILIHGEGERTFNSILNYIIDGSSINNIKNISYSENGKIIHTEKEYSVDISDFPSPYTMGLFDGMLNDPQNEGTQFDAVLETTRGCPYSCIYCSWSGGEKYFRRFPIEKVKAELRWMAEHKIAFCFCADSNFGILKRDIEIAEYLVELKKEYGYLEKFESISTTEKSEVTFKINKMLHEVGMNGGISVAVQSMTPKVLEAVGRKNISVEELRYQLDWYRQNGMGTYTDLILILPEETYDSFCRSVFSVIEAGQHNSFNIFRCELLPNTILNSKEIIEKYKIKSIRSNLQQYRSVVKKEHFKSRSNLVVSTSTISEDEWVKANRLVTFAQAFHCYGISRYISIYLRKAKNISYYDFYMAFFEWVETESVLIKSLLDRVCHCFDLFIKGQSDLYYCNPEFGGLYLSFEEALFLHCVSEIDDVFNEINMFLERYDFGDAFKEVCEYQKDMISRPQRPEKTVVYQNDWHTYFEKIHDRDYTEPTAEKITVTYHSYDLGTIEDYDRETVWRGKRKDKMIEKNITVSK